MNPQKQQHIPIRFMIADPDFIPRCIHDECQEEELSPLEELCEAGALAYECVFCGCVRYFDSRTGEDITDKMI